MRNFASKHNQVLPSGLPTVLFMLLVGPINLVNGQEFTITSEDMVAIHADQAWEDIEPDTVHFSGHFEMRVRDMVLHADRASVYGKLDNPDRLVMEGSPTHLSLSQTQGDRVETVQAQAKQIIFERGSGLMRLNGDARLAQGDNVLFSEHIEYDIRNDRFQTLGHTGVEIDTHPQDQKP
jgi:lipopolysaccharide transport protein LptA